ncbi:MAG: 5-bromo-4-chloroindolyl phosphate hydrolysis family protein [bacterium]|nr:5-bromo-4-chloroindolyl phosphate hydrolysis family protein [bacterium]
MSSNNDKNNVGGKISDILNDALTSGNFDELSRQVGSTVDKALDETVAKVSKGVNGAVDILGKTVSSGINSAGRFAEKLAVNLSEMNGKKNEKLVPINKKAIKKIPVFPNLFTPALITGIACAIIGDVTGVAVLTEAAEIIISLGIVAEIFIEWIFGLRKRKVRRRYKEYISEVSKRGYFEIEDVAEEMSIKMKKAQRELSKMIEYKVFPEGHINDEGTFFFGTDEMYDTYLETMKAQQLREAEEEKRENENAEEKQVREALETGERFVARIRAANDYLIEQEISEKLDTTERIVTKIFERIGENPEQLPQARKFIQYYLPLTEKLVDAYKNFDERGLETENIKKSKQEIKHTLDTINQAFCKLYENLFEDEVIDVNSDISLLRTMLAQEGLSDNDLLSGNRKG